MAFKVASTAQNTSQEDIEDEDDPFLCKNSSFIRLPCPPAVPEHHPTTPRQRPVRARMVDRTGSTIARTFAKEALVKIYLPRLATTVLFIAGAIVGFIYYFAPGQLAEPVAALRTSGARWNRDILQWAEKGSAETLSAPSEGTSGSTSSSPREQEHDSSL